MGRFFIPSLDPAILNIYLYSCTLSFALYLIRDFSYLDVNPWIFYFIYILSLLFFSSVELQGGCHDRSMYHCLFPRE